MSEDELFDTLEQKLEENAAAAVELKDDLVEVVHRSPIPFAIGGLVIGAAIGGGVAFLITRRKLETKYNKIAETEIESMREHYQNKAVALESGILKRIAAEGLESIIAEEGYSSSEEEEERQESVGPPMAVPPPPAKPGQEEIRNIFRDRPEPPVEEFQWSFAEEHKKRDPNVPYVIHVDEIDEMDYQTVSLVYYDGDGVLCNERDEIFDPEDLDRVIGEKNLDRFGHGSGSPDLLYIRNDNLELVYEIAKADQSYAEAVHGFTKDNWEPKNRIKERMRERDEQARE